MIKWCHQLASAVAYLASIPIIHRDIAARNCLLSDEMDLKLCDFGLAKLKDYREKNPQHNFARSDDKVAIPWAAPECLESAFCTPKSDVWSLGVTMWEFLNRCQVNPYEEMANEDHFQRILFF